MKLKSYLDEAKKMKGTMIGFGVDKSKVKRLQTYIKSWLDRFKVDYDEIKSPHISIAQIPDTEDKDNLVRTVNSINKNISFNPKQIHIFRGQFKDFIVIEYKTNKPFIDAFYEVSKDRPVKWFGAIKPHTSLFSVEKDSIDNNMWDDMLYSMPKLPKISAKNVELWNSNFEVEFKA
jgi:hypothetical protein